MPVSACAHLYMCVCMSVSNRMFRFKICSDLICVYIGLSSAGDARLFAFIQVNVTCFVLISNLCSPFVCVCFFFVFKSRNKNDSNLILSDWIPPCNELNLTRIPWNEPLKTLGSLIKWKSVTALAANLLTVFQDKIMLIFKMISL